MKTKMLFLVLTTLFNTHLYASAQSKDLPTVTNEVVSKRETKLEMTFDEENNRLIVTLSGEFDPYSSVSITNNRGSEYYFQFVGTGTNQYTFNLEDLEAGSYFLVLNTNEEIRIKPFQKN